MDYTKNMTSMKPGSYRAYVRVSDGVNAYLFPLKDIVLNNGSTLILPKNVQLIDQVNRELRVVIK